MSASQHKVSPAHLVLAARQGDLQTCIRLCQCDPACAAKADDSGETALQVAAHAGNVEILSVLLQHSKATIDMGTPQEKLTPLHLAAARGHAEACRLLLENGAKVDVTDTRSYTPLHHAAFKGNVAIVQLLIEKNAQCNPPSSDKAETPLALAAFMRHAEIATMLLNKEAKPAFINNSADRAWAEQVKKSSEEEVKRQKEDQAAGRSQQGGTPKKPVAEEGSEAGSPRPRSLRASNKGAIRPSTAQRGASGQSGRSTLGPVTPVFVPPAPLDLDDAEALRFPAARGGKGGGNSAAASNEPAIWFTVHEETLDFVAEEEDEYDDDEFHDTPGKTGEPKYALYRALTKRARTNSQADNGGLPLVNQGSNGVGSSSAKAGASGDFDAADSDGQQQHLHLFPLPYLGMTEGLMLDQERRFVYYLDPAQQQAAMEAQQQQPRVAPPFSPLFVGRWETAAGGPADEEADSSQGYIKPLKNEWHCMQMEAHGSCAKRCLRQASAAAAWLHLRSGIQVGHFTPSTPASPQAESLLAPPRPSAPRTRQRHRCWCRSVVCSEFTR